MPSSISFTLFILLLCFSKLEYSVLINVSTILNAVSRSVFSPNATQLVLLSSLVYFASSQFDTFAQYTPLILFKAILIPIPLPHIATPKSTSLFIIFFS